MADIKEAPHNRIIRVFSDTGKEISQRKVILRAGDLARPGYYGTVNVDEGNFDKFTELMKTPIQVRLKPGILHTLAAKLTGSNATERIRTFDKEWTPQIIPPSVARALFPPNTNFEDFNRRVEAYRNKAQP